MRDPLEEQRELYRRIEEAAGISQLRDMQEDVRWAIEPHGQPHDAAVQEMLADARRQQEMIESCADRRETVANGGRGFALQVER